MCHPESDATASGELVREQFRRRVESRHVIQSMLHSARQKRASISEILDPIVLAHGARREVEGGESGRDQLGTHQVRHRELLHVAEHVAHPDVDGALADRHRNVVQLERPRIDRRALH